MGGPCFTTDENGELSAPVPSTDNFSQSYPFDLALDTSGATVRWTSVEAYFQASKFPASAAHQEAIRTETNIGHVFQLGRTRSVALRDDWEEVKATSMYNAVKAKFSQNEAARSELLATTSSLAHPEGGFWGEMNASITERVREELREEMQN